MCSASANDNPLFLALDQGGGSSRALVFDRHAGVVAKGQQSVGVNNGSNGWVEQDADELVESIITVIGQAARQLGADINRLAAAGLATQRSNVVCWDRRDGSALSPAISWQDRRAYQWMNQFRAHNNEIRQSTGLLVSAHYGVSKLKWCLENLPAVRKAQENGYLAYGPLASYLVFRLASPSRNVVDPANASRTLLWNINQHDWDRQLLTLFDIPGEYLPACVATHADYGVINIEDHVVPLTIVTGDQSAALYAYGQPDPEKVYINMGTGVFIQRPTGRHQVDVPRLLCSVVYQNENDSEYVVECTVNGASNALVEVEAELGIAADLAEQQLGNWFRQYTDPPLFLNGVAGLGAPFWVPDFPSRFIGEGSPEEKIVAVAESILFLVQVNLALLAQRYTPSKEIMVTGGLANSDILCQKLANLIGIPVYRPVECEATARGVGYLTARFPQTWHEKQPGQWFFVNDDAGLRARYQRWHETMMEELKKHKAAI
ncbi:MAG: FGGY family carbohydrate kinase [Gammaproteobacteria bacterium]|jgi:glycerol kinase